MATGALSDIQGYVTQLINLERTTGPEKYYQSRKSELTSKSATLTDLDTNLSALNTQVQSLFQMGSLSPFAARTVTFSTVNYATATADSSATLATHTLQIGQLAKQSTIVSSSLTAANTDISGRVGAGTWSFTITVGGNPAMPINVDVAANDTNQAVLTKMAAAINASGASVTAQVVSDTGSTVRLQILSKDTGSDHAISLIDPNPLGGLLSASGTSSSVQANGSNGGYLYANGLLDANFVLDGLAYTRGSNTVADSLSGVSLTLTALSASAFTFTVAPDQAGIKTKVQAFLDAYNTSLKFLKERTNVSVTLDTSKSTTTTVTSVTRGTLADDFTYMGLRRNLRSDVGGQISSASSNGPKSLRDIGITVAADGTLSISDSTKFTNAVSNTPDGVTALFSSSDGIATRLSNRLASFVKTGGILDNSQASVTASIKNMNTAIDAQEKLLAIRQEQLTKQYEALAEVMAQLSIQQSVVAAYLSGLNLSGTTRS